MNPTPNPNPAPATATQDLFWPVLVLAAAFLLFNLWQIFNLFQARAALRAQFEQRRNVVAQSGQVEQRLEFLVNDLLTLSQSDPDARELVKKYNIQRSDNGQTR